MSKFFSIPILLLFNLSVFSQSFTEITLSAVQNHSDLSDLDAGDFNNDGLIDIALVSPDSVFIFKNNGLGSFLLSYVLIPKNIVPTSAIWVDLDEDRDLDLVVAGEGASEIYGNDGQDGFSLKAVLATGKNSIQIDYADFDNDGDFDLISSGISSLLIENTGPFEFSIRGTDYPNSKDAEWGDLNKDGFMDLIIASAPDSLQTDIYLNNSEGSFVDQINLPYASNFVNVADYNADGWLDVAITLDNGPTDGLVVFNNNGDDTFTPVSKIEVADSANIITADIDNDGLLDFISIGKNNSTSIFTNNGDSTYTETVHFAIESKVSKGMALVDIENDGDLDVLTITDGLNLYQNEIYTANVIPTSPQNLSSSVDHETVYLSWDEGSDTETQSAGLSYNIYLYEENESEQIRPAHTFDQTHPNDGIRKVVKRGDVQMTINYPIHNLKSGTYYWSVQTIDAGLKGSKFAPEQSFQIKSLSSVDYNVANGVLMNTSVDFEYSLTSTDGIDGNWQACDDNVTSVDFGNGGFDLYVREAKNTANFRWLGYVDVPSAGPVFTIDFANERTNETVPSEIEYSLNSDMSSSVEGDNSNIEVTPGVHIFFRIRTNDSTLASMTSELVVPLRPSAPYFDIDFFNERTYELVADDYEYGLDFDLSDPVPGSNEYVDLTPGQDLFFREKATLSSFKSEVFTLEVDDRPLPPTNPVLYTTENYFGWTNSPGITRTDRYECSLDSGQVWEKCMSNPFYVGNNYLQIGVVQVRVMATDSNFESLALLSTGEFNAPVEPPIITSNNDMDFEVSIYPNPVQDRLTVNSNHSHFQVLIFSTDGLSIRSEEVSRRSVSLDINDLTSGVYILTISIDGKVPLKQIFVKN